MTLDSMINKIDANALITHSPKAHYSSHSDSKSYNSSEDDEEQMHSYDSYYDQEEE